MIYFFKTTFVVDTYYPEKKGGKKKEGKEGERGRNQTYLPTE
jgi:hypothetical protein